MGSHMLIRGVILCLVFYEVTCTKHIQAEFDYGDYVDTYAWDPWQASIAKVGKMDGAAFERPTETPPLEKPAAKILNNFAFKLFNAIATENSTENEVFSPLSIFTTLATLRPGLNGNSLLQLDDVTGLDTIEKRDMNDMYDVVFERSTSHKIKQANRIYVDRSVKLAKKFKKELKNLKLGQARRLNFRREAEQSRRKINKYVRKRTKRLIEELVPEGAVSPSTVMYLVNAIYLKAKWSIGFSKSHTKMRRFKISDSESRKVPTMWNPNAFCTHINNRRLQASLTVLSLGENLSMVFMTPKQPGNFSRFYDSGNTTMQEKMTEAIESIWTRKGKGVREQQLCSLKLPKFKVDVAKSLNSVLRGVGLLDVFDPNLADMSRMTSGGIRELYVSEARHSAVLRADEVGIEAAGASGMGVMFRSISKRVTINKPFIFALRHDPTGAIIFLGKVVRPGAD